MRNNNLLLNKILILLFSILLMLMIPSKGVEQYTDNNLDTFSNIDSFPNIAETTSSIVDIQTFDGNNYSINEKNYGTDISYTANSKVVYNGLESNIANTDTKDSQYATFYETASNYSAQVTLSNYFLVGDGNTSFGYSEGTIEFWVKMTAVNGRIWGQEGNFEMRFSSGSINLDWGGSNSLYGTKIFDLTNHWYYYAVSWSETADTLTSYWGDETNTPIIDSTTSWTSTVSTSQPGSVTLGNSIMASAAGDSLGPVDGKIDEFRVWSKFSDLSTVQNSYDKSFIGNETNLEHYYNFENNLLDISGNYDLTPYSSNYAFTADSSNKIISTYISRSEFTFQLGFSDSYELDIFTGNIPLDTFTLSYLAQDTTWQKVIDPLIANSWNNISIAVPTSGTTIIKIESRKETMDTLADFYEIDFISIKSTGGIIYDYIDTYSDVDSSPDTGTQSNVTALQDSGGSFNTLTETASVVNSKSISAPSTSSYISLRSGNADFQASQGTISFWVNILNTDGSIWGQDGSFRLLITSSKIVAYMGSSYTPYLTSTTSLTIGQWYFVALTWNDVSNYLRLYIGDETTIPTLDTQEYWSSSIIGKNTGTSTFMKYGTSNAILGNGDDLRFYNIARSLTEIQSDYNLKLNGNEANLKYYYPFETDIYDVVNGYTGTLYGLATLTSNHPFFADVPSTSDFEYQFTNIVSDTVEVDLSIYTGTMDSENLELDVWNGATWITIATDLTASSWNNITVDQYIINSNLIIRFSDGDKTDITQSSWQIDYVGLYYKNYLMSYEMQSQAVTTAENYMLTIYGSSSEIIDVELWNSTSTSWTDPLSTSIDSTKTWYNNSIPQSGVVGTNITYKLVDTNQIKDTVQSNTLLDYVGVSSYNILPSINSPLDFSYIEQSTGNLVSWVANDQNPNGYEVFIDSISDGSGTWNNSAIINYNIDGLVRGSHNITIVITDDFGYATSDTVWVTVNDITKPILTAGGSSTSYAEGSSSNQLSWTFTELHPNTYDISRNGTPVAVSQPWSSGVAITLNVDGLSKGYYEYIIHVYDDTGNEGNKTTYLIVYDNTAPVIQNNPPNDQYNEGIAGTIIQWNVTDNYNATYEIYRVPSMDLENPIFTGNWNSGEYITINVEGLFKGSYNYTLYVYDESGNVATDWVIITVVDQNKPIIDSPSDFSYKEGTIPHNITWTVSENHPTIFSLYLNSSLQYSFAYTTGEIVININGLNYGVWEYLIILYDESGNSVNDTVFVTIYDNTDPIITLTPDSEVLVSFGSTGNTIEWKATDIHPNYWKILRNGTQVDTGSWVSGGSIITNVDGLSLGSYNFTIIVYDSSGNSNIDQIIVKVTSQSVFTKVPNTTYYVEGTTNNSLSWVASDLNPDKYIIYQNGTSIQNGTWQNEIAITVDIDGLSINIYNFTIWVNDTDNNWITSQVYVVVSDMPLWDTLPSDLAYNEGDLSTYTLQWNATDMYPDTYAVYQNGVYLEGGSWQNSTFIEVDVSNLSLGVYNYTIFTWDTVNNIISDWVIITITDVTAPTISGSPTYSFAEGSSSPQIQWTGTELHTGNYSVLLDGVNIYNGSSWTSGVAVNYNLDSLTYQVTEYNFTIILRDSSGNYDYYVTFVTVTDNTDPVLVSPFPSDDYFIEGTTGHYVYWNATDSYAYWYFILQDGFYVYNASWTSGTQISYNIDELTYGNYMISIIFMDESNNNVTDAVLITVNDEIAPWISTPGNTSYDEGTTTFIVNWNATDNHAGQYMVIINGTKSGLQSWTSSVYIPVDIGNQDWAVYNVTVVVYDQAGNYNSSMLWLTVNDNTNPVINSPPNDILYNEGSFGNQIIWSPTELHPGSYEILKNNVTLVSLTNWDGSPISLSIDGLSPTLGIPFNYTIIIYDQSGNIVVDIVFVEVDDVTAPSINVPIPIDMNITEFDSVTIKWYISDLHSNSYIIEKNGTSYQTGNWTNSGPITLETGLMSQGEYNFTIIIYDISMNNATHTIIITVKIDTDIPNIIASKNLNIESGNSSDSLINWTISDLYPDTYRIYTNGTSGSLIPWVNTIHSVGINVDFTTLGITNYTIIVYDASGNYNVSTVWVTVEDTINPVLESSMTEYEYSEGVSSNFIIWRFTDVNPGTYTIYKDGQFDGGGIWTSNSNITHNVDDIKGVYLYTIYVKDLAGNTVNTTIEVRVIDTTDPVFKNTPSDTQEYTEGQIGNTLSWTMTDNYENIYLIYRNGTLISNGTWTNNVKVEITIDGLSGTRTYNYTIVIFDKSNNTIPNSNFVRVVDRTVPKFEFKLEKFYYVEGSTNNELIWRVYEIHPDYYELYRDGLLVSSKSYSNNETFKENIDGLYLGKYNYSLIVFDSNGNSNTYTIIIDPIDLQAPKINTEAVGFTYNIGTTGNTIIWNAFDLHPGAYIIYLDGKVLTTKQWNNNEDIVLNVDGYEVAYYNFTIDIYDTSQNIISHSIIIRVKDPSITDTNKPILNLYPVVHEGDVEIIYGNWTTTEDKTIIGGNIAITLYRADTILSQSTTTTGIDGSYNLKFNYTGLDVGNYYWMVKFEKPGYQTWDLLRLPFQVIPHTYIIQLDVPDTLVQGESYYISAIVSYANYSRNGTLGLSTYIYNSGGAPNVEVSFVISYISALDQGRNSFNKQGITDQYGSALIEIFPQETLNIAEIIGISASISNSDNQNAVDAVLDPKNAPIVLEGSPSAITVIILMVEENLLLIILIVAVIVITSLLMVKYNRDQKEKVRLLNESIRIAYDELQAIQSIQAIIIQTTSKLTIYEENVVADSLNTNIVGGMVTAFSSFLNEISTEGTIGFEIIERDDISLTVHKGKYSNFIVISKMKLPMVILMQIQGTQRMIEEAYKNRFTNTRRGVRKLTKSQVHTKFSEANFKLPITDRVKLNMKNYPKVQKQRSISRSLKQNIKLLEKMDISASVDGSFTIKDIQSFYDLQGITDRVVARVIMLSYEFNILEIYNPE